KFVFGAKFKNRVSEIQWLTDCQALEKATLRQNHTDCKIFHAPANDATARRISENFLGEMTVEYEVMSYSRGGRTMTPHRVSRALLTPDEVQMLAPGQGIAHVSGHQLRPFVFDKLGFDPHYERQKT